MPSKELFDVVTSGPNARSEAIHGTTEEVKWISILEVEGEGDSIGLDERGRWVFRRKRSLTLIEKKTIYLLLPLLETPLPIVSEGIRRKLDSLGIVQFHKSFPFHKIVKAGLMQGSDYWAHHAFSWYPELSKKEKLSFQRSLEQVSQNKRYSQKVRQRAKRELQLLERST